MAQIIINIVQGVGGGIGFVSEAYKAHKTTKAQKQAETTAFHLETSSNDTTTTQIIEEEEAHELTKPQSDIPTDQEPSAPDQPTEPLTLAEAFIARLPSSTTPSSPSPPSRPHEPLPYPIMIPQRRPTDRSRGFLSAYPPILASRSISESLFLDFLHSFNTSTRATKWIAALNLASIATVCLPTLTSVLVSMAITAATTAAMEIQGRVKTNLLLDKVNAEFFMPRGLFCLVVTWNPDAKDARTSVDFEDMARKTMARQSNGKNAMKKLKKSSAETHGEFEWGEVAPLVYPSPEELIAIEQAGKQQQKSSLQKKKDFVDDFMDRRAQAKFAMQNPDSALAAGPKAKFTSRFADPSHAANSGSLVALISGGAIQMPERQTMLGGRGGFDQSGRIEGRAALGRGFVGAFVRGDTQGVADNGTRRGIGGGRGGRAGSSAGPLGLVQKVMKKDVLYLLIVDLPSKDELAAVQGIATELLAGDKRN